MTSLSKNKYRPVLTQIQISHIIDLCKRDMTQSSISVIAALSVYEHKILNQSVKPAHTITRQSLSESIGLSDSETTESNLPPHPADLWETYLNDPNLLSVSEILEAKQWAYVNDKMSPPMEKEYENYIIQFTNGA